MEGSGSLPDGAFERFVTSALAAIITIVFSWRLLAEGQEQLEGEVRPRFPRPLPENNPGKPNEGEKQPTVDIPVDETVSSSENANLKASPKYATLATDSEEKQGAEDSPSWGDYSWEEDMYDTVHTRRNVRDFTVKRSSESSSSDEMEPDIQLSPIPASHDMLEKLYMNQEYQSIVDDADVESDSDSSSDNDDDVIEGVFEPPIMEPDMFFANGLEPIMEEDSDDFSENEMEDSVDNKNNTYLITTGEHEPGGNRQDLVYDQSDKNISLPCTEDISCQPELVDDNHTLLDNFIDECFDHCGDDLDENSDISDRISDKSESLPPSPIIRTRAIDDENANLSDESCSSESVITVVSVKSDHSDTPEIQIVEESNKPLSFTFNNNEHSVSDNLKREDIIAFIHGSNENLLNGTDLDKTPDTDHTFAEIIEEEVQNRNLQAHLDYDDFVREIKAVSETNREQKHTEDKQENVDSSKDELQKHTAVSDQASPEENELFIKEETDENDNSQGIPSELRNFDSNELSCQSKENFEKRFDDDVGPREYNPYEDDFAEFEYCDSDDDSFYLVCGQTNNLPNFNTFNKLDSGNLRNFETFDNLDAIGLSPGLESPCESGISDDGRFIFSRTEDISTEYHTRVYVKDRNNDAISSKVDPHGIDGMKSPEVDPEVENKNSYNESKLYTSDALTNSDPIISDLENIELFIDENQITDSCKSTNNNSQTIDSKHDIESIQILTTEVTSDINNSQPFYTNDKHTSDAVESNGSLRNENTDINGNSREASHPHSKENENNQKTNLDLIIENKCEELHSKRSPGKHNDLADDTSEHFPDDNAPDFADNSDFKCNTMQIQENGEFESSLKPCIEILSRAHDSGIDLDCDRSKSDSMEDFRYVSPSETKCQILDMLHNVKGNIVRSSAVKPSSFKGGSKAKIKKQQEQQSRSYFSVLLQPVSPECTRSVAVVSPEKTLKLPQSRQKIIASRQRFLSEQNLSSDQMQEQFKHHKASFEQVTERKPRYVRRGNSLPRSKRSHKSYDKLDFNSLNSSRSSVEKPEICSLHENCMFSPQKHQEIVNRTLSIDNLESNLMRYGSVTSLVETDIDSGETTEYQIFTDFENDFEFQFPLERTASMSDLATRIKHKKESKGRFSDRNVPKSKSLCTLETNIDDVTEESPRPGTLGRVPSVHELRVTKSLQKLNVPDWYKKSSVSRSGSTWSLYSSPRKDSFSTTSSYNFPPSITSSPCPSVSLSSNSVVIRTRVTPTSAKLYRAPPKLQTTPEKSPTPISVQLPSDKLRQKDKPKELMPIPIVPFSKLRLMFEESSRKRLPANLSTKPSPTSPVAKSIESPTSPISPTVVAVNSPKAQSQTTAPSQTLNSKPAVPAKPILKKDTSGQLESKNVGRVEPQQAAPLNVQPMSTSPRSARRVETTFNGSVGQTEVRKPKETTFEGEKPVQVVRPKVQEQNENPQISKTAENQNEHNSKSARYSSISKSLKSAFRRPQKPSAVDSSGSKIETTV